MMMVQHRKELALRNINQTRPLDSQTKEKNELLKEKNSTHDFVFGRRQGHGHGHDYGRVATAAAAAVRPQKKLAPRAPILK